MSRQFTDAIENTQTNGLNDSTSRLLFEDAYCATVNNTQAAGRGLALMTTGPITGALEKVQKDPVGTIGEVGTSLAVSAGLGALAVAESPYIAMGAIGVGAMLTAKSISDMVDELNPFVRRNQKRNKAIGEALGDTLRNDDRRTFERSLHTVKNELGDLTLAIGLNALGNKGIHLVTNKAHILKADLGEPRLAPATVPNYSDARTADLNGHSASHNYAGEVSFSRAQRNGAMPASLGCSDKVDDQSAQNHRSKKSESTDKPSSRPGSDKLNDSSQSASQTDQSLWINQLFGQYRN